MPGLMTGIVRVANYSEALVLETVTEMFLFHLAL